MSEPTQEVIDAATTAAIHACRAAGVVPARLGSAGEWTVVITAALRSAFAAGWVPPEEAEALREEVVRTHERVHVLLKLAERAVLLKARLAELESSWLPPERVEEIDCPVITHRMHLKPNGWTCPLCRSPRGSGKLRIVRGETT